MADVERSRRFYITMGFRETFALMAQGCRYFCELAFGTDSPAVVMLIDREHWRFRDDDGASPGGGVIIYVPVPDATAVWNAIGDRSMVYADLAELYYGREFVVQDPDGYRVAFFEPHPEGERLPPGTVAVRSECD